MELLDKGSVLATKAVKHLVSARQRQDSPRLWCTHKSPARRTGQAALSSSATWRRWEVKVEGRWEVKGEGRWGVKGEGRWEVEERQRTVKGRQWKVKERR